MRRIGKLVRLPAADRRLLASAAALLAGFRLGLWLLPFDVVQRAAGRLERGRRESSHPAEASAQRVAWAVDVASRFIPASHNCLNRALAAKVLLARRGLPVHLRFGVRRAPGGELRAHAWIEGAQGVLVGDLRDLPRYTPLLPLDRTGQ